ncbi:protein-tyrosine-phosphatase [Frondihabitans sucicola]|uniref:Protein-tyrosine-phosphatase n=1 Tax=Frondihabitans sucicola TaxID=1268041 RepID=A0ABM8GUS8_9MICO|nr:tyrosine-protein phosphatase [Frondihabitans sucicola]BDZ52191.1 protein-tyrosine-phosphatase [Frondihabitans sucicola]
MTTTSTLTNLREVGGAGFQRGRTRTVLRANTEALPASVYPASLATVVDLRRDDEIAAVEHPLRSLPGYRRVPLFDPSVSEAAADAISLEDQYTDWLWRHRATIAEVFRAIAAAAPGDVLVCCSAGKDRTGVVSMLLARLWGADLDRIGADYAETGPRLADRFAREREESQDLERTTTMQRCVPETAVHVVRHVESEFGSVTDYLRAIGLTDDEIDGL